MEENGLITCSINLKVQLHSCDLCLDYIFHDFSWKNYCSDLMYVRKKDNREM